MRGIIARRLMLAAVLAALGAEVALASSSRTWITREADDLQRAHFDGVALASDGSVTLSAKLTTLLDPAQPYLWCLAKDAKGNLYAGGGNDGRVFKIPKGGGQPTVVFDSSELQVHSVAVDSSGRLFAATSPRGAVYMVVEGGAAVRVFDPEQTYIWAISFDARDRLYVATGLGGKVYRVDRPGPGAAGVEVLTVSEDHIRSLAVQPDGTFYAGSDPGGILYRVSASGEVRVVFDSPMREINALHVTDSGIYAAALAPMQRQRGAAPGAPGGGVTRVTVTAGEPEGEGETQPGGDEDQPDQSQSRRRDQARPAPPESYFGAVFKISPDGYAQKIWESRDFLPLSIAPAGAGRLMIGTGNEGQVFVVDDEGDTTRLVPLPSQEVSALLPDGDAGFIAAASNLGKVVRIEPDAAREGTVTAPARDAGFTSTWGAISWTAETPPGTAVTLQVRTGNTEEPDASWSEWSRDYTVATGTAIERPRARFLQWRARLNRSGQGAGPTLRSVQVGYLQDNLPPEVETVEVAGPGVALTAADRGVGGDADSGRHAQAQPRRSIERGKRSVIWKGSDGNDDPIRYDVYFKAEDETLWKRLARDLEDSFLTWDSTAMPDGVYRLKIAASDA
ncbi:MAG TPA: hypothetical protein VFG76_05470, partial [Candidatus Polarisedimenticolia bacterium]|nr:hypothetical protein [Candidatus Polarisedimenticolia bacterium]